MAASSHSAAHLAYQLKNFLFIILFPYRYPILLDIEISFPAAQKLNQQLSHSHDINLTSILILILKSYRVNIALLRQKLLSKCHKTASIGH